MKVKEILSEAKEWGVKHTGRNTNKSVAQLEKEKSAAKKRGDTKAVKQKDFAIRAKRAHGGKWKGVTAEAWEQPAATNPEKKGMFAGKTVTQLQHELNALLKAGPHPKGTPGYTKMKELEFAIRAKKAKGGRWGGVKHDNKKADEEDCQMTVSGMM